MSDKDCLNQCRKEIEEVLALGDEQGNVRTRDLEYLMTAIESKSGIKLSLSTLKRIWRSDDDDRTPQPATLNALVSILGFESFQDYKLSISEPENDEILPQISKKLPVGFVVAIVIMGLFTAYRFWKNYEPPIKIHIADPVKFTADKTVDKGIPNTVVFEYDLTGVEADSFFIQQSWNPANKTWIDTANHFYSSTYYTPGYHMARLMANDSVLAYQPIHLLSDGWFPLVKYHVSDVEPIYISQNLLVDSDSLHLGWDDLEDSGVDISEDFLLRYYNVGDFKGLVSDNFLLETRFRCDPSGAPICPSFQVMLIGEGNVFYVPMIKKGCEGELSLLVGEQYMSNRSDDLSSLGVDIFEWNTLEWQVIDKQVGISLNGNEVLSFEFKEDFGEIKGIIYTFNTLGEVAYTRLLKGDEEVALSLK